MLVFGIELRDHDIDDLHRADRSVPDARRNPDAHSLAERDDFLVELHFRFGAAFEDEIGLRQPFVIVQFGVGFDLRHVDRRRIVGNFGERPFRDAAGARSSRQLRKVDDLPSGLYGIAHAECFGRLGNVLITAARPDFDPILRRDPYSQGSTDNSQPNHLKTERIPLLTAAGIQKLLTTNPTRQKTKDPKWPLTDVQK